MQLFFRNLAVSLALVAAVSAFVSSCADEAPATVEGEAGSACQDALECLPGLFCLGGVCQEPLVGENNNTRDLGPSQDSSPEDQGRPDAGQPDAGQPDAGQPDAQIPDAQSPDTDAPDTPEPDMGSPETCTPGMDSDGDSINDEIEGDGDTDGDGTPDCLDTDSDNDGLTDREEVTLYDSDPTNQDSDGDGASDLLEWAAGSSLIEAASQPEPAGQLVVISEAEDSANLTLRFTSDVRRGDVYFLMDTSTTMDDEIVNLKQTITQTIIPGLRTTLSDVQFGVGRFDDFAMLPYGENADFRAYENLQNITADATAVDQAINDLETCCSVGNGRTFPESQTVALWSTVTGNGLGPWIPGRAQECTGIDKGGFGYPCFRADALPIIVMITDAAFHNGPGGFDPYENISPAPPTFQQASGALVSSGAKVVSVVSGTDPVALSHASEVARRTQTLDAQGDPLVYSVDAQGNGLDTRIIGAFGELIGSVRRDVTVQAVDPDESDEEDPTRFVQSASPVSASPPEGIQGIQGDTFLGVAPGTAMDFEITLTRAGQAAPAQDATHQTWRVDLRALGDGSVLLDEQTLYLVLARQGAQVDLSP